MSGERDISLDLDRDEQLEEQIPLKDFLSKKQALQQPQLNDDSQVLSNFIFTMNLICSYYELLLNNYLVIFMSCWYFICAIINKWLYVKYIILKRDFLSRYVRKVSIFID